MAEWNVKYLQYWSERWDIAMSRTENFSAEIRSKDAVDRHEERNVASFDTGMGQSTERVAKALACIRSRGYMQPGMTALDIGSGTGTFTIPFAGEYASVTSLDISAPMQDMVRQRAEQAQLHNIEYLLGNWHTLSLANAGMADRYDLVLSSINCRGIYNYETLNKMNRASRGGCCLMTWAGRSSVSHAKELQHLILGRTLTTAGGNDITFPFNLIYHMGGEPDLSYATLGWEKRIEPEKAVEGICFNYWRFAEITDAVRTAVRDYVYSHLESDGCYVEKAEHLIGIMVWDAWRIKEAGLA